MARSQPPHPANRIWPFLAGITAGAIGAAVIQGFVNRRPFDYRLLRRRAGDPDVAPAVLVPGILGSELIRPDGTEAWLNLGNALGHHDISLPVALPLSASRDDLVPGGLLGIDTVLPRLFGFTEYNDLVELLDGAGFGRDRRRGGIGATYHVFTYDWRRDLIESARALHVRLEALADALGDPDARFNVIGHSMGGLVARYYLRYGPAEPDGAVTWAGARRIRQLVLVATPNSGSMPALDATLNGDRVGLSSTTLASSVIASMPSIYQLLPPPGAPALLGPDAEPLTQDLLDPGTWETYGWGPFAPPEFRRRRSPSERLDDVAGRQEFVRAALARARAFHEALVRVPDTPCPVRVVALGGDCLPTLARAIVTEKPGAPPRFEAWSRAEAERMFEAGDGRVTRASVLAAHLPGADDEETGSGLPEVSLAFFGSADHHGIYREATFQSVLLRLLMRPGKRRRATRPEASAPR